MDSRSTVDGPGGRCIRWRFGAAGVGEGGPLVAGQPGLGLRASGHRVPLGPPACLACLGGAAQSPRQAMVAEVMAGGSEHRCAGDVRR